MRRTIRHLLSEFSDRIIECDDGAKAFVAYGEHLPDWVLMDIEMPEKDGLTATREIRAAFPQAHVVIVTKHDDAALREAAEKAGAAGFITKENLLALRGFLQSKMPRREPQRFPLQDVSSGEKFICKREK